MREIKFRAWDRKRKKMWYPNNDEVDFYAIGMSGALYALDENGKYDYTEEFEKMIFMQFTGLKDSNGKEIYDGDIVSWLPDYVLKNSKALIGKVVWGCEGFYLEQITDEKWQIDDYPSYPAEFYCVYDESIERLFMWEELEVIGNIYENPELLKEVENG